MCDCVTSTIHPSSDFNVKPRSRRICLCQKFFLPCQPAAQPKITNRKPGSWLTKCFWFSESNRIVPSVNQGHYGKSCVVVEFVTEDKHKEDGRNTRTEYFRLENIDSLPPNI